MAMRVEIFYSLPDVLLLNAADFHGCHTLVPSPRGAHAECLWIAHRHVECGLYVRRDAQQETVVLWPIGDHSATEDILVRDFGVAYSFARNSAW